MKLRLGFVSNSSSSSFVLIGGKVDSKIKRMSEEDMDAVMKKYNISSGSNIESSFYDALYSGGFGFDYFEEEEIAGYLIADVETCDGNFLEGSIPIEDIIAKAKIAQSAIKEVLGVEVPLNLVTGTRAC